MAHEIETYGTQAAAVFAREDAWHKLGTTLDGAFTAEQAMEVGHLGGWNVRKTPLTTTDVTEDGVTTLTVPGKYAMIRTNPFTGEAEANGGVVGTKYVPVQNEEHCEYLNRLIDESGAILDTAGSLRGGLDVFVSLRLPREISIGGIDPLNTNIVALNNHDGSSPFTLLVTPVRVVCKNTQTAALSNNSGRWSARHTKNAMKTIEAARQSLDMTFAYVEAFEVEAEKMIQETMTDAEFWKITAELFGELDDDAPTRTRNATVDRNAILANLWSDAVTQENIRGTRWAGYQAIGEYVDHFAPVRSGGDESMARASRLLTSPAAGAQVKRHAWSLCSV